MPSRTPTGCLIEVVVRAFIREPDGARICMDRHPGDEASNDRARGRLFVGLPEDFHCPHVFS